jgi:hypothetical protein
MGRYKERHFKPTSVTPVVTDDVTIFNWTATDTTLTPTRVDTATAGTATGNITFNATDATAAANIQTAIRALGGIYADATCVAGATADNMVITVYGGYDITWAKTGGTGTITESGAAGADTAVPGKVTYTGTLPIGRFGVAKRIRLAGFNDNSLDVSLIDQDSLNVFVKTAIDTSTASADTPYDKFLTADGVAGEDGAAAANVSSGLFTGPLDVIVATSAPLAARTLDPFVTVFVDTGMGGGIKKRSTGTFLGGSAVVNLGDTFVNVKRIHVHATSDQTVAPAITDAYSKTIYSKSATDYTTAVEAQLSAEGVDQAANAVADLLDVVVKSPATVTLTGHDGTGFEVVFYVES